MVSLSIGNLKPFGIMVSFGTSTIKLSSDDRRRKAIQYTTKYCIKEIISRIENNEDTRGQRFFFTSNNLSKPSVTKIKESLDLEEIIFSQMENMISDGEYCLTNDDGIQVNKVRFIEYRK